MQLKFTFNRRRAQSAKLRGMDAAAMARSQLLDQARQAMIGLASSRTTQEVDADDIARWLIEQGRDPSELGPATPSVFRSGDWEWTGNWRKSARISNHYSDLRVWRLRR